MNQSKGIVRTRRTATYDSSHTLNYLPTKRIKLGTASNKAKPEENDGYEDLSNSGQSDMLDENSLSSSYIHKKLNAKSLDYDDDSEYSHRQPHTKRDDSSTTLSFKF